MSDYNIKEIPEDFSSGKNFQVSGLSKSQKIAVTLLAFFALLVIVMWGYQFQRAINSPFEYKGPVVNEVAPVCADGSCEVDENDLSNQDTDGDGLNDYEELNFYKTSPYLEDSDSDGYSDKNEIESDNDPNCPIDQDCYGESLKSNPEPVSIDVLDPPTAIGSQSAADVRVGDVFKPDMDAASLRQLLIQAGVEASILEQISDEQLLKTYQDTLAEN